MDSGPPLPEQFPSPPPAPAPLWNRVLWGPNGLRAGWRLLIYVVLLFAVGRVLRGAIRHIPALVRIFQSFKPEQLTPVPVMIGELQGAIEVLLPAFILAKFEKRPFGDYGIPLRSAFGKRFWQGVVWGLAEVTVLVLLICAFHGYSFGDLSLHGESLFEYGILWALVFLAVGVFEEFAFRGYSQSTLASGIGFWPAAVVLSACFGYIHLNNPGEGRIGALSVFMIAMFFCLTLRRTGSLWFAIGMHASFDWGETYLYSVPNSGVTATGHLLNSSLHGPTWVTGGTVGPEGSAMAFLTMILLFVIFNRFYPAKTKDLSVSPRSQTL